MGIVVSAGDPDFLTASLHAELAQRPRAALARRSSANRSHSEKQSTAQ